MRDEAGNLLSKAAPSLPPVRGVLPGAPDRRVGLVQELLRGPGIDLGSIAATATHSLGPQCLQGRHHRFAKVGDLSLERFPGENPVTIQERSQFLFEPCGEQRLISLDRADGMDLEVEPEFPSEQRPDVIDHPPSVGRREEVSLAEEHHGRNPRPVEGAKQGQVFPIECGCRVHEDHTQVAPRQVRERLGPARERERPDARRVHEGESLPKDGRGHFHQDAGDVLPISGIPLLRGIFPEVFESDVTRPGLRARDDQRRRIARDEASRDGRDGGHPDRKDVDASDMIQQGRFAAAHPAEDRHLEARVLQSVDDHLERRPEFHELPPRDDLLQLEEGLRVDGNLPKARQASLEIRPKPLPEIRHDLVDQSIEILAYLGDPRMGLLTDLSVAANFRWPKLRHTDADEVEGGLDRPTDAHPSDIEGDVQFLQMSQHRSPDACEVILNDFGLGRGEVVDVLGKGGKPLARVDQRLEFGHPPMDIQEAAED